MIYRVLGGLVPTLLGWGVYSGAIPVGAMVAEHSGLSRDVPASVAAVSAAVADLDVDYLTHGSSVAPGVAAAVPLIERMKTPDGWTWQILTEDKVALELIVTLQPIDGGLGTHVETSVRSVHALSPTWRLAGPAALAPAFADGIEAELNPLLPPGERLGEAALRRKKQHSASMLSTVQTVSNPVALATGGDAIFGGAPRFEPDDAERRRAEAEAAGRDVSFEPGKPMVRAGR